MSSHALKLKHQDKDPGTRASEPILSQIPLQSCSLWSIVQLYHRPEATIRELPGTWTNSFLGTWLIKKKNQSLGGRMGYWPHFQSVFLLENYTGDAQIQPMVIVLQFNFKIWGAPKWVTFPPLAKPHKWALFGLLDGHLLCCSKQTNILVVNPKHLHMLSLPKPDWCKYFEWCNFGDRLLQRQRLKNQTQIAIG